MRSFDPDRGANSKKKSEQKKKDIPDSVFEKMDCFSEKGRSRLVTLKGKGEGGIDAVRTCTWCPDRWNCMARSYVSCAVAPALGLKC